MTYIERKRSIINLLKENNGACKIDTLCQKIYCSRSTIRRDLINLESAGIINRYHGGVSLVLDTPSENSVNIRRMENPEKKAAISKLCQNFLKDNMVLFLDSSSTVSYLNSYIRQRQNMTIITNGINIAGRLNTVSDLKCYLCPGLLKHNSLSIVGAYALNFMDNFSAEIAFISCKAINEFGIFEGDDSQALIKRKMMQNSKTCILLCDNSKESSKGYFKLANFNEIDIIISNAPFSEEVMRVIEKSSCQLVYSNATINSKKVD